MTTRPQRPEKLTPDHDLTDFSSGSPELDQYLRRHALTNQRAGMATVFVSCRHRLVVGYYALATGGVAAAQAPARVLKGLAQHAIPVIVLARLAVDHRHQRAGLGSSLLRDALRRVNEAADIVGVRAILIHAKDERAREWYQRKLNFDTSPVDPYQLFLLMKDLRRNLEP